MLRRATRPSSPSKLALALLISLAVPVTAALPACIRAPMPGAAQTPMGSWPDWIVLIPLIEVAKGQASDATIKTLKAAGDLLKKGHARSADRLLAKAASGPDRHWISVARGDIAALHFTLCIRGIAWRLPDDPQEATSREVDFDPATPIKAGDLAVEALLTNLDAALAENGGTSEQETALGVQARIARARVSAYVSQCAPNEDVERRANGILGADLATLAAGAHLTPDLAYLWAGVQMNDYSGAAARPFLLLAQEGGFTDPSVTYMLAIIALEAHEFDEAEKLAAEAAAIYAEIGDTMQQAQCEFIRGEAARSGENPKVARARYEAALKLLPSHVAAIVGMLQLDLGTEALPAEDPSQAASNLHARLPLLEGDDLLDATSIEDANRNLEALVIMTNEDLVLAQVCREALLMQIDDIDDPAKRGLRYFYAATLDVRLGDYQAAQGHAVTAELEFDEGDTSAPVNPREFLDRLAEAVQ